ncbi:TPA: hypothetical protein ACMDS2_003478 [Vibrio parahaemolyticus]|uniref:hypothetical protein n=1 Tax=Vibrio parahaemolyticus TaxID=670 RepID=UPI00111D0B3A|nr:hypothetical protein [Vibrio parahaemolyticus]EGR3255652.1 hypothetical protein [Vibrio parahaemolyticus]EJG0471971.1 hypothetical protein [Vibrio parahaemolyticus]TOF19330.1 hypothetical protein CGJ26_19980 [Vibrio parahaemolyticus]
MKRPTLNKIANILFFAITIYFLFEPTFNNWLAFDVLKPLAGRESEGLSLYLLLAIHWLLYMIILIHVKDIARYGSMKLAIQHSVEKAKQK